MPQTKQIRIKLIETLYQKQIPIRSTQETISKNINDMKEGFIWLIAWKTEAVYQLYKKLLKENSMAE